MVDLLIWILILYVLYLISVAYPFVGLLLGLIFFFGMINASKERDERIAKFIEEKKGWKD